MADGVHDDMPTDDPVVRAAVLRFAREGFGSSLRAIAQGANVSAALIIKRFGSKAGLRAATDECVLTWIRDAKLRNIEAVAQGQLLPTLLADTTYAPLVGYVMQSVISGGPLGRNFVEQMVADAEVYTADAVARGLARPSRDEHARARYLVTSGIGAMLLSMLLDPPASDAPLTGLYRRIQQEMTGPMLELYTEGLFTTPDLLNSYLADAQSDGTVNPGNPESAATPAIRRQRRTTT